MTGFIDDIIQSHHPMTSPVEKSLADKITLGDHDNFHDLEKIPYNHIVSALGSAVKSKPKPHKIASFMEVLDAKDMMNSVVESFFDHDKHKEQKSSDQSLQKEGSLNSAITFVEEGTKSAIKHGYKAITTIDRSVSGKAIDVAADLIAAGFDPTGLRGVQLAADTAVLLLRAAESQIDQNKRPILFSFIDSVAAAGELTGTTAAIASNITGIGILSEIFQQTAQWGIKEGMQAAMEKTKINLDKAVNELPPEKSQAVKETTPKQAKDALAKVEIESKQDLHLENIHLDQSHHKIQGR